MRRERWKERHTSSSETRPLYASLEGGGTKMVCAVGYSAEEILARRVLPTRDPEPTLTAAADFFAESELTHGRIRAIGLAFFGPLDLRRDRPTYGRLLSTPKPSWTGVDLLGAFSARFDVPIALDTDVAAAALAEWRLGAGRDVASLAYVTVGTGIGVGFAPQLPPGTRLLHPEAGHLRVGRAPGDQDFAGVCPFHGDCLEGLACGPAIRARWGCELERLPPQHAAWDMIGHYLGQLAGAITLIASVERVVFGGGVMTGGMLLPHIRRATRDYLAGYISPLAEPIAYDSYLMAPGLGDGAGLSGAFLLAQGTRHT